MNKTLLIFLGFLCLLLPAVSSAEMDIYRQVDTAKKCSICHYRWLSTFYIENRGTPLTPLEEEKVVGKQKMCLSCHDGTVALGLTRRPIPGAGRGAGLLGTFVAGRSNINTDYTMEK